MGQKTVMDLLRQLDETERVFEKIQKRQREGQTVDKSQLLMLRQTIDTVTQEVFANLDPEARVAMARHPKRPHTIDYIRLCFDKPLLLSGDRVSAEGSTIIGGPAKLNGQFVMVIGHEKGRTNIERERHHSGSARPADFRKAQRLMELANKFKRPIICFIDTLGAAADVAAEEQGVSAAIARNLAMMSTLDVPTVSIVLGEGGSGGALGIGLTDRILMLQYAIYSVISMEGAARILRITNAEAAKAQRLTAHDALELGIIDEVLPEPIGSAYRDYGAVSRTVKYALVRHLGELSLLSAAELREQRYQKYRQIGQFTGE